MNEMKRNFKFKWITFILDFSRLINSASTQKRHSIAIQGSRSFFSLSQLIFKAPYQVKPLSFVFILRWPDKMQSERFSRGRSLHQEQSIDQGWCSWFAIVDAVKKERWRSKERGESGYQKALKWWNRQLLLRTWMWAWWSLSRSEMLLWSLTWTRRFLNQLQW